MPSRYAGPLFLKKLALPAPGYSSQRLKLEWLPGTSSTSVKGPVPSTPLLPYPLFSFLRTAGLKIAE